MRFVALLLLVALGAPCSAHASGSLWRDTSERCARILTWPRDRVRFFLLPWAKPALLPVANIWTPEQQREVHAEINARVTTSKMGLRFQTSDPDRPWMGMKLRNRKVAWRVSEFFYRQIREVLGDDLGGPLVDFVSARERELVDLGFGYRAIVVAIRTEESMQGLRGGHAHARTGVTVLQTEFGARTPRRVDGRSWRTPVDELVPVPDGHAYRFVDSWHAEPSLAPEEKRLLVLIDFDDR